VNIARMVSTKSPRASEATFQQPSSAPLVKVAEQTNEKKDTIPYS
jgi:hypothetical protein